MPPEQSTVCRFAAEPPQDGPPTGDWGAKLREEFLRAVGEIDAGDVSLGEPGELSWHPDRSWAGRTFVPVTAPTSEGLELFGYVSYTPADDGGEHTELFASADFTDETADRNPEWRLDLCDEAVGSWRGLEGEVAAMTLVWGRPLVDGGAIATAELGSVTVDQCGVVDGRFALLAPDDYRDEYLVIKLFDSKGNQLASESLYDE